MANTLGLWSDLEGAGGTLQRRIKGWVRCRFGVSVDGETGMALELPSDHDALADIRLNSVFRVDYRGTPYEYRVMTFDDDMARVESPITTVTALPAPLHDLGFLFLRQTLAGVPTYAGSASLLAPLAYLTSIVLPSLTEQGRTYYDVGTVTPTLKRSMEWDGETILSFLRRLIERDDVEVSTWFNPVSGLYEIGLERIGSGATQSLVWVGDNAVTLQRSVSRSTLATVVRPTSPVQAGAVERDHVGAIEWGHTARTGAQYTLAHPAGDTEVDPIAADDQFNSQYAVLRLREGAMNLANTVNAVLSIHEGGGFLYHAGSGKTILLDKSNGTDHAAVEWTGPLPTPSSAVKRVAFGAYMASTMAFGRFPLYAAAQDRYLWPCNGTSVGADTKMVVYNPNTGAVVTATNFAGVVVINDGAVHAANGYAYFGDGNNQVQVYDPATDSIVTAVAVTSIPVGVVSGASQSRVYVWCSDRKVRVINPAGHTVTATLDLSSYVTAAYRGAAIVGTNLYVSGREVTTNLIKVLKVSLSSVDSPSYTTAVTAVSAPGSSDVQGLWYSATLDRILIGGRLLGSTVADGAYVVEYTVTGSFALGAVRMIYEDRSGFVPYSFNEIDGVPYWHLGKGVFVAMGDAGTNHQVKAVSDSVAATNQLVTLASAFPATQTDRVTGETALERALLRISDGSDGRLMTELPNDGAVQDYDRVVREIRSEEYLIGDASSIGNLLPNGGLRSWDADGFLYGMAKPSNRASSSAKGPRWTSPDANAASQFSAGVTATWSSGRITTITVSGLPAGLVAQAGDQVSAAGLTTVTLCGRTVCTGTADVLSVFRIDQAGSGTGVAATLSRPLPSSMAAWMGDATDVLALGNPTLSASYEAAGYTYTSLGAAHTAFLVSPPLWPRVGANLYIGADVGYMMYSGNFPASQKGGLGVYKYHGDTVALEVYADDLPTAGVTARTIYPRFIEGSISLTACHQPLLVQPVNTAATGVQMYIRRLWAYVANESHAAAMALDGAGPVYRLWRLGQQSAAALSVPQINYTVQALEKQAAPFEVGGDTRLVDRSLRGVDAVVRIVAVERDLVEDDVEREFPVLTVNNRENDLTSQLLAAGAI